MKISQGLLQIGEFSRICQVSVKTLHHYDKMTVHRGGYSSLSEAYGAIVSWISENEYEIAGAPFDLYIKTQFDSLSPDDWETEVYFPIKKKQEE